MDPNGWVLGNYSGSEVGLLGDINIDENVNILDIIQLANMILSGEYTDNADLNGDGTLNILDIISLANIILGS